MAVGDIYTIGSKLDVEVKLEDEQELTKNEDIIIKNKIADLKKEYSFNNGTIRNKILTESNNIDIFKKYLDDTIGKHLTSEEYLNSSKYLNYFPNIPSDSLKLVYYTDVTNLLNSVSKKVQNTIKTGDMLKTGVEGNTKYNRFLELKNISLPSLKTKIDKLLVNNMDATSLPQKSFKDVVEKIKTFSASTQTYMKSDIITKLDSKGSVEQDISTQTRYYDNYLNKYFKLYVNDGKFILQETLHPLAITYSLIFYAKLFFGSFNNTVLSKTEAYSKITTYKSLYYTTHDNRFYSVVDNYIYIYNNTTKLLLAKIKFQPTSIYEEDYENYSKLDLFTPYTSHRFLHPSTAPSFYMNITNNHIIFGNMVSAKFAVINNIKLEAEIEKQRSNNATYIDEIFYKNSENMTISTLIGDLDFATKFYYNNKPVFYPIKSNGILKTIRLNGSTLTDKAVDNLGTYFLNNFYLEISRTNEENFEQNSIASIYYDDKSSSFFIALKSNFIFRFELNVGKKSIDLGDGELVTNYNCSCVYKDYIRLGINTEAQNNLKIRSILFDNETKKIYALISNKSNNELMSALYSNPSVVYSLYTTPNKVGSEEYSSYKDYLYMYDRVETLDLNISRDEFKEYYKILSNSKISGNAKSNYLLIDSKSPIFKVSNLSDIDPVVFKMNMKTDANLLNNHHILLNDNNHLLTMYQYDSRGSAKYSLRMYDKTYDFESYNSTIVTLNGNSEDYINNNSVISSYNQISTNYIRPEEQLVYINHSVIKNTESEIIITIFFESTFRMNISEETYIKCSYKNDTIFKDALAFSDDMQKRNIFEVQCKFIKKI